MTDHSGIKGNYIVDELARKCISAPLMPERIHIKMPMAS